MKLEFDIIKPNLYMHGDDIYFSADDSYNRISVSKFIDKVVSKHLGDLKVQESVLKLIKDDEEFEESKQYSVPLSEFLDVLEKKNRFVAITNNSAKLFDIGHLIDSQTNENSIDVRRYGKLKEILSNPDKHFDESDERYLFDILDREKSLEKMKKLYNELDSKMLENNAEFLLLDGHFIPSNDSVPVGRICFSQVKTKDKTNIEKAKTDLIEILKQVEGPCLSLDSPGLFRQACELYGNASKVIANYGDIIKDPLWKTKFFKLDP